MLLGIGELAIKKTKLTTIYRVAKNRQESLRLFSEISKKLLVMTTNYLTDLLIILGSAMFKRKCPRSLTSYLWGALKCDLEDSINETENVLEELFRYLFLLTDSVINENIKIYASKVVEKAFHSLSKNHVLYCRICDEILTLAGIDSGVFPSRLLPLNTLNDEIFEERKIKYKQTLECYKKVFGCIAPLHSWPRSFDDQDRSLTSVVTEENQQSVLNRKTTRMLASLGHSLSDLDLVSSFTAIASRTRFRRKFAPCTIPITTNAPVVPVISLFSSPTIPTVSALALVLSFEFIDNVFSFLIDKDLVHAIEAGGKMFEGYRFSIPLIDLRPYAAGFGITYEYPSRATERIAWYRKWTKSSEFIAEMSPSELPILYSVLWSCGYQVKSLKIGIREVNLILCLMDGDSLTSCLDKLVESKFVPTFNSYTERNVVLSLKEFAASTTNPIHLEKLHIWGTSASQGKGVGIVDCLSLRKFSNICELSIGFSPGFLELISTLPNLEVLKCRKVYQMGPDDIPPPSRIVSNSLKHLDWVGAGKDAWISHLFCPSLKSVIVMNGGSYGNGFLLLNTTSGIDDWCLRRFEEEETSTPIMLYYQEVYYYLSDSYTGPIEKSEINVSSECLLLFG